MASVTSMSVLTLLALLQGAGQGAFRPRVRRVGPLNRHFMVDEARLRFVGFVVDLESIGAQCGRSEADAPEDRVGGEEGDVRAAVPGGGQRRPVDQPVEMYGTTRYGFTCCPRSGPGRWPPYAVRRAEPRQGPVRAVGSLLGPQHLRGPDTGARGRGGRPGHRQFAWPADHAACESAWEVVPPSPVQVLALADAINPRKRAAVLMLVGFGLRIGEVLELRVADVDFPRGTVRVERQVGCSGP